MVTWYNIGEKKMWYVDNVGLVKTPRGLTLNGVQHPRNIFTQWTKAELAAVGIKPASITAVDTRYKNTGALTWNLSGAEAVGTYATTDKDVATIKDLFLVMAIGNLLNLKWFLI